jgi:hypothetical protein
MRCRSLSIHLPTILLILVACAALARPAAAQHCWPSSVALLVRDDEGALIHPRELTGYTWSPQHADGPDMKFVVRRLEGEHAGGLAPDGTHALQWSGHGDCRIDLDEVVLHRGGTTMRLRMHVRLNTLAHPGHTEYVIDTPPFQAGTWELDGAVAPVAGSGATAVTADRWRRLPDGVD